MGAPIFLSKDDVYRILQRESPEDLYPDGPATGFASTADMYSHASVLGDAYSNLNRIYENYFPQTADENQPLWEQLYFGMGLDTMLLTLQQRRDRVIAKIRTQRRTTPGDMLSTVYTIINSNIPVEIVENCICCGDNGWILDFSQLDISTILNGFSGVQFGLRTDWCSVTAAQLGLTQQQYLDYRSEAYTYEVRIYGYTLTATERSQLDSALNDAEPARSQHLIIDGLNPADMVHGNG